MRHAFSFLSALIAAAILAACAPTCEAQDDIAKQLSALKAGDRAGLDSLAQRLDNQNRRAIEELISIAFSGEEIEARKASYLLGRISDLALLPLLEAKPAKAPLDRVWQFDLIVTTQLNLHRQIVSKLEQMLTDKRIVHYSSEPEQPIEEAPLEERVCDRAYIHLQKLNACSVSDYEQEVAADAYLRMSFAERDRKIAEYLRKSTNASQNTSDRRPPPALAQ